MKLRTTLALATVGGGLFAYIWFVDRHQSSTNEATQASTKVLKLDRDKVTGISIRNSGTQLELRKKDGIWNMEQPLTDLGDSAAIEQLLGLVANLRHDSKINLTPGKEAEQLKDFGVAESELSLKLKPESGSELELLVGKDSAIEGKIYVRQKGQNAVYVVRNDLRTQLIKKTDDFRDHRLSAIPFQSVQKITVKTNEGEIDLERQNQHWNILKPLRARAADAKIKDLLAGVLTATVSQFHPETPTPEQSLAEPRATVTLQVEGQKEPVILQVGATPSGEENKDKTFAKISTRKAVTVIPNKALDPILKARPNDLRDRKLLRFEPDIVDRITIQNAASPPILLARKGETWVRKDGDKEAPVRDGVASKLLADLQTAESINFVADLATDLGQYGLAAPAVTIRLASYSSENTPESKAGEKIITSLLIGTVEADGGYVKLEDEPYVVAAPRAFLDSIPADILPLLPLATPEALFELKPESITGLQFHQKDAAPISVEKKDGSWSLADAGTGTLDTDAVQKIEAHLVALKVGRISDPTALALLSENLNTQVLSLKVKTSQEGKEETQELHLGLPTKHGEFPVKLAGKEEVFLLSPASKEILAGKVLR